MISGQFLNEMLCLQIDASNIGDHSALDSNDECFFLYEYTPKKDYKWSDTNSLISNIKKSPEKKNEPQYYYKKRDIKKCSNAIFESLGKSWFSERTLIPIPPSKAKCDPKYDDRMLQVCDGIRKFVSPLDVRELIYQKQNIPSSACARSSGKHPPSIEEITENYVINNALAKPSPKKIGIVDDVLTAGNHFKAMQRILQKRFPQASITGIFIARCVPLND